MAKELRFLTGEDFKNFLAGTATEERKRIRDRFLEMTGLAYPSWYSKQKNLSYSKLELLALSEICSGGD